MKEYRMRALSALRKFGIGIFLALMVGALLVAGLTVGTTKSYAAKKLTISRLAKGRGAPTIKVDRGAANPTRSVARPASKGGKATRDEAILHINSESNYYLDIYVDGYYQGSTSPWGDLYIYEDIGEHDLYATAPGTGLTVSRTMWCPGTWTITD